MRYSWKRRNGRPVLSGSLDPSTREAAHIVAGREIGTRTPLSRKARARETGGKGRVQKAASPTTQMFRGYQPIERKGMLVNMPEVPEGEPFNIINALSAVRKLLTVDEIAEFLGKSKFTIYRMAQKEADTRPSDRRFMAIRSLNDR